MSDVQIAGVRCAQCDRRCVSADDGVACDCGAILHRDECWRAHKHQSDPYREAPSSPPKRKASKRDETERGGALFCVACERSVVAVPKVDFLGFPSFNCPKCGHTGKLPLVSWRRLTYQIVLGVVGAAIVVGAIMGVTVFPGLLVVAIIIALVKDSRLRREIEARALVEVRPMAKRRKR